MRLRVQDAKMSTDRTEKAYFEMVRIIRRMYQEARLVHADLSEWNVLFHEVGMPWRLPILHVFMLER